MLAAVSGASGGVLTGFAAVGIDPATLRPGVAESSGAGNRFEQLEGERIRGRRHGNHSGRISRKRDD